MFFLVDGKDVYPPLPACPMCGKHKQHLICLVLMSRTSEYYLACENCANVQMLMLTVLDITTKREVQEQWQAVLHQWDKKIRKNAS